MRVESLLKPEPEVQQYKRQDREQSFDYGRSEIHVSLLNRDNNGRFLTTQARESVQSCIDSV